MALKFSLDLEGAAHLALGGGPMRYAGGLWGLPLNTLWE